MADQVVTVQSAPRIYCDTAGVPWQVRETNVEQPRPGALPMRRKEPAPGLVTVKELVTEQLRKEQNKGDKMTKKVTAGK